MKTIAATFGDTVDEQPMTSAQFANTLEDDPETRENPVFMRIRLPPVLCLR